MGFDELWRKWDAARANGRSPADIFHDVSDDSLIELLAGGDASRRYEKDIIRTELRNRLSRRQRAIEDAAARATRMADRVVVVAEHTRDEAVETELLARGVADLDEGVEFVAEQAEDAAVAAEAARQTAEEAEIVSGRVQAAARSARARVKENL